MWLSQALKEEVQEGGRWEVLEALVWEAGVGGDEEVGV